MGNPHCSVLVPNFESVDWLGLGREIERSEHFPNRTNVEFVRLISRDEIEVRFWERGVGTPCHRAPGRAEPQFARFSTVLPTVAFA